MTDPRIPLKNPWLAALLAYLLPGAGHLYQGRFVKGAIYGVCILGMFLYGLVLSDGTALYMYEEAELPGGRVIERRNWGFLAQMGIGTPAALAFLQTTRFQSAGNAPTTELEEPLHSGFEGRFEEFDRGVVKVTGHVELEPIRTEFGPDVAGTFVGTAHDADGTERPLELRLGGGAQLGRPVSGSSGREFVVHVVGEQDGRAAHVGILHGDIQRSLANRIGAPVPEKRLQKMHGQFGKLFELALIYTWIAGLLNILAVWDAFEGPAYGYGDEKPADEADTSDPKRGNAEGAADEQSSQDPQRHAAEAAHHAAPAD